MKGWQTAVMEQDAGAMWLMDAENEWERLNEPDPFESQMKNASVGMKDSARLIGTAEDRLASAIRYLRNTPMEDRVISILNGIEDLCDELKQLAYKYERGERE